ncbi:MAG: GGDEF domain-containing phosphodiesterase [Bacteroides sp.]|nr:GGDEF domain-containing phosphodiesterase [Eubacterium sp.]MCM1418621.1 GGDEF domain-containing phosphodiesterase [Roseburia sp.]MCM1462675.1 GGDEF domain-containing phosphodiesterase [Bacteroides sp.]
METLSIPQSYRDTLIEMMSSDKDAVHFLWDCNAGKTFSIGEELFKGEVSDPLDYFREKGLIHESSLAAFNVFSAQVEEGILGGSERGNLGIDVMMRLTEDGEFETVHFYMLFLRDPFGRITYVHGNIRPYTQKEVFDKQVLSVFTSDKAPQIYTKRIREMMNRHPDEEIAFIQFDVERFKMINEIHGVEVGDELLKFINDSLGVVCTEEQPFCRLTADVFMIVTPFASDEELVALIRRIESMLSGYKGIEYRLVFGVAIAEDRTIHTRRHGDNASLARQLIKGNALNNVGFYNGRMKSELHKKQTIEEDMQKALLNNEFVMYLQPKHCISTGKIIGAEALARWIHPKKGMISPADFIPVFEENGFILKLDQFIWESACKKLRMWLDAGIDNVPVSINISCEYIRTFDIAKAISELIEKYAIPARLLELEITESAEAAGIEEVVWKLKDAGFTMLMDDFGSGYSSLNMLKTTPFDILKIDRSFLSQFMESERGRKIISHTISMSRDIGLGIVAEGVETIEQAKFLRDCGCDTAQGFFYSKPIPADEFDRRLFEINGVKA